MTNFDLDALSAPLEALRDDVTQAYKRLDAAWAKVAAKFEKLPIPIDVSHSYWGDKHESKSLEYRKLRGAKRFCITTSVNQSPDEETIKPYEEWSASERRYMLKFVPKLMEDAVKQIQSFIESTK